ncbi:hypothetical protein MIR68_002612 [Amoeboaphelidium protococcarum]|nr:hypothetical protein MIR68_002612 [Amoeboaphelidium protococcarum]KAI3653239.1 hypothetical protein MP228_002664 [Amoeboaphelidium protococcarum]
MTRRRQSKSSSAADKEFTLQIKEAFQLFDKEQDGFISRSDVPLVLKALNYELADEALEDYISNNFKSNVVGEQEFISSLKAFLNDQSQTEAYEKAFNLFDVDGEGFITYDSLRKLLKELNEEYTDEDIQEMIAVADNDGDGRVGLQDFKHIMQLSN